ncbi:hypothetical protein Taro_033194 [Colocasia esculenta]|uniref:Pentatricopeptide repeat-containing protein n=1 Tax=Colocasia esculenta TaxID=4460 RepID=A0A843WBS0_COLES|nr:hypothetical protein [Colocasia esculenta]
MKPLCHRCPPLLRSSSFSSSTALPWFSPPSPDPADPILAAVSDVIGAAAISDATGAAAVSDATGAAAVSDSPGGALDSSPVLRRILPSFSPSHFVSLLSGDAFFLPAHSLLAFFRWLSLRPPQFFRHTLETYLSMAHFLCRHRMPGDAAVLLRTVVSRKGRNSAHHLFDAVLRTSADPPHHCSPHPSILDAMIIAYADSGYVSDAIQCVRLVRKARFRLPLGACGRLLDQLMKLNSPAAAWAFYSEILGYGFPPNVYTFNVLMHSFCKEGKLKEARLIFDEITKRGAKPTVVSFNTLINGYCKSGNLDASFELKNVMQDAGIFPDGFTYSALINGLSKERRLGDANQMFKEMCLKGLVPNNVTFTTLIDGHCKDGKVHVALDIYEEMLMKGVMPDLITYNALVNGLCKFGDLQKAKWIVEEMKRKGLKPDKVTYTTLIDGCCKEGDLESASEIRRDMIMEKVELDDVAYTALISGLCREGRAQDAERILHEMTIAGMIPDEAVNTMVIDGLCKKGDVKSAFKLLKEMQSKGHRPGVVTYNAIMNGLSAPRGGCGWLRQRVWLHPLAEQVDPSFRGVFAPLPREKIEASLKPFQFALVAKSSFGRPVLPDIRSHLTTRCSLQESFVISALES